MTDNPLFVRPFVDEDYPRFVAVANAAIPEVQSTVEEARHADQVWDRARYHLSRVVAELDGQMVGWGQISHMPSQFDPRKYFLQILVEPPGRRRGAGGALYDRLLAELRERQAAAVRAEAKESMPEGVAFLEHRGFMEIERAWESRLDVSAFDAAPFAGAVARAAAADITFTTLAVERERNPDALHAAYDLFLTCMRDVPAVDPVTPSPYEHFIGYDVEGPDVRLDGYFLALDGDRYIGQSNLYASEADPGVLYQGLTGVRPEHRGKGIALALKLLTIDYARDHGVHEIRTWNNTRNRPMLRINEAMGFVKQPVWIVVQKTLTGADGAEAGTRDHAGS